MRARVERRLRDYFRSRARYKFFIRNWTVPGDIEATAAVMSSLRPSRALTPYLSDGPESKRITVIAPHPDDEVMGPGGTLIRSLDRGADISVIYLTDGEVSPNANARRREEAQAVADSLGFETVFLGLPVNAIPTSGIALDRFAETVAAHSSDVLFIPFLLDDNDDHRRASELLMAAGLTGKLDSDCEVWAYQVYSAFCGNVLVPLGDAAERKIEAIRMFRSQAEVRDWAHFALGLNAFNTRFTPRECKDPYVEAFFVLPLDDYLELCQSYFRDA